MDLISIIIILFLFLIHPIFIDSSILFQHRLFFVTSCYKIQQQQKKIKIYKIRLTKKNYYYKISVWDTIEGTTRKKKGYEVILLEMQQIFRRDERMATKPMMFLEERSSIDAIPPQLQTSYVNALY